MGALSPETVELISTTEEGAVRDRVSARFIIMAAHETSLEKWLRDNRASMDFAVASLLCKQFGEVTWGVVGSCNRGGMFVQRRAPWIVYRRSCSSLSIGCCTAT
jgi:hypothetical protein